MTFKDAYNLINDKKLVVAYTLKWQQSSNSDMPQDMSDLTIHQNVIYTAKMEERKYDILEEMGFPPTRTEIVLFDVKNNEIARGEANETRYGNVFLSIEELTYKLQLLLKREANALTDFILDDC